MARIENYSYTPQQAFNECYYEVPDYQRGYVWSEREVTQLLDDINEQADADAKSLLLVGCQEYRRSAVNADRSCP